MTDLEKLQHEALRALVEALEASFPPGDESVGIPEFPSMDLSEAWKRRVQGRAALAAFEEQQKREAESNDTLADSHRRTLEYAKRFAPGGDLFAPPPSTESTKTEKRTWRERDATGHSFEVSAWHLPACVGRWEGAGWDASMVFDCAPGCTRKAPSAESKEEPRCGWDGNGLCPFCECACGHKHDQHPASGPCQVRGCGCSKFLGHAKASPQPAPSKGECPECDGSGRVSDGDFGGTSPWSGPCPNGCKAKDGGR